MAPANNQILMTRYQTSSQGMELLNNRCFVRGLLIIIILYTQMKLRINFQQPNFGNQGVEWASKIQ